jgi:Tol biopolymer transport system component
MTFMVGSLAAFVAFAALLAGGSAHRSPLEASSPTWSPDGTQIAFAYLGARNGEVAVMNATDGGGKRVLYRADSCCEPVLWAAGNRIAFVSNFELFTVGRAVGKPAKLFTNTPWFILAPNGQTIALDSGCGCGHSPDAVALVGVRGGKPFVIPRPAKTNDSIDGFSPDGTELVFTRGPWSSNGAPKGKPVIMVASVRGGRPIPLSRSGLIGASYVPPNAVDVQWSPDGKWIAFVAPSSKPTLELVSTAGGRPKALVPSFLGSSFSWSPTPDRIAYARSGTPGKLVTVDLKGDQTLVSGSINWISEDSWDRPQWSPDGTKLVFMGLVGPNVPGRTPAGVWIVGADGHGLKRLA